MGFIHVPVTLRATKKSRKKYQADFLVDTGATDSMAPGKLLQKAGFVPDGFGDGDGYDQMLSGQPQPLAQSVEYNGGFYQYFENSAGDLWPFVMQVMIEGNDAKGIRLFEGVLSIFPDGKPAVSRRKRWEQLDQMRRKDENGVWTHFDKYSDEFYKHSFPDEQKFVSVITARKSDIHLVSPT